MSNGVKLEQEGRFKARVTSWAMKQRPSGAVCVTLALTILEQYDFDEEKWVSWAEADEHYVYGDFYVIKKDGKLNTGTVEQLWKALAWDGDPEVIANSPPPTTPVQIEVKAEQYQGNTYHKASWIDPVDHVPSRGTVVGASGEELVSIKQRFGAQLRAATAVAKSKAPAKPTAPVAPVSTKEPRGPNAPTEEEARKDAKFDSDIPF